MITSQDQEHVLMLTEMMLLVGVFSLTFPTTTHPVMFHLTLLLASQMMVVLGRESVAKKSGVRLLTVIDLFL